MSARGPIIQEAVEQILEGFKDLGLTPQEGDIVAELVLWNLMQNAMKMAAAIAVDPALDPLTFPDSVNLAREKNMRIILRLSSRVQAWPAKVEERS